MTIKSVEQYKTKARNASETLSPLLTQAIKDVSKRLNDIDDDQTSLGERKRLAELLQSHKPDTDGAELALQQYVNSCVPRHLQRNGKYIVMSFSEMVKANKLNGVGASKAANALLAASRGLISTGIIDEWPKGWEMELSPKQAMIWLECLAPDEAEKYEAEQIKKAEISAALNAELDALQSIDLMRLKGEG